MAIEKKSTTDLLNRMIEQEKTAETFGFYWHTIDQMLEQVRSESHEIKEAWLTGDQQHLKEEVGDLINAAISLSIFLHLDPHEVIHYNIEKFQRRYETMVKLVEQDGLPDLKQQPLETLLSYWDKAKKSTKT